MKVFSSLVFYYSDNVNSSIRILSKRHKYLRNNILRDLVNSTETGLYLSVLPCLIQNHRIWTKPRSSENWDLIMLNKYNDQDWLENFRMTKETYTHLCSLLRPSLEPKEHHLKSRDPLSVEKQVAVALYKMCSCSEYRVVGSVFGIHKSTVKKCLYRVVNAIIKHMLAEYIYLPNEMEAEEIAGHFEAMSKIPMIIGVIDGTHIPITPPKEGYRDFVNRKGWPSYNMQALVDHKCRFRNICIQTPGSVHDATVFKGSKLFKFHDTILPQKQINFHNISLQYMIIGDPAYPLLDWLLKGFSGTCTPVEESFNVYLNSARIVVEWAFGRLKARFRMLHKKIDTHYTFVPKLVVACCIIHNFIEDCNETFVHQWIRDVEEAEIIIPQPRQPVSHQSLPNAVETRKKLSEYLAQNYPLRQSIL